VIASTQIKVINLPQDIFVAIGSKDLSDNGRVEAVGGDEKQVGDGSSDEHRGVGLRL